MNTNAKPSAAIVIGALVAVVAMALAAILFIGPESDAATQRLGLFFGLIGLVVTSLLAVLRADQAATQTNGKLDARIRAAVLEAQKDRRRHDDGPASTVSPLDPPQG